MGATDVSNTPNEEYHTPDATATKTMDVSRPWRSDDPSIPNANMPYSPGRGAATFITGALSAAALQPLIARIMGVQRSAMTPMRLLMLSGLAGGSATGLDILRDKIRRTVDFPRKQASILDKFAARPYASNVFNALKTPAGAPVKNTVNPRAVPSQQTKLPPPASGGTGGAGAPPAGGNPPPGPASPVPPQPAPQPQATPQPAPAAAQPVAVKPPPANTPAPGGAYTKHYSGTMEYADPKLKQRLAPLIAQGNILSESGAHAKDLEAGHAKIHQQIQDVLNQHEGFRGPSQFESTMSEIQKTLGKGRSAEFENLQNIAQGQRPGIMRRMSNKMFDRFRSPETRAVRALEDISAGRGRVQSVAERGGLSPAQAPESVMPSPSGGPDLNKLMGIMAMSNMLGGGGNSGFGNFMPYMFMRDLMGGGEKDKGREKRQRF